MNGFSCLASQCVQPCNRSTDCGAEFVCQGGFCVKGTATPPVSPPPDEVTACPEDSHDGGDGTCVLADLCSAGFHDGGGGLCLPLTVCSDGFHDGGDGTCVASGVCVTGYRPNDRGDCVPETGCGQGLHDGGDGRCVTSGSCSAEFHDGGFGGCVALDLCAPGFRLGVAGDCEEIPCGNGRVDGDLGEVCDGGSAQCSDLDAFYEDQLVPCDALCLGFRDELCITRWTPEMTVLSPEECAEAFYTSSVTVEIEVASLLGLDGVRIDVRAAGGCGTSGSASLPGFPVDEPAALVVRRALGVFAPAQAFQIEVTAIAQTRYRPRSVSRWFRTSAPDYCYAFPDGDPCPDDGALCTEDRCVGGLCSHPSKTCAASELCDPQNGSCYACYLDSHCASGAGERCIQHACSFLPTFNDTGQYDCFGTQGPATGCPSPGDITFGEDASYGPIVMDFSRATPAPSQEVITDETTDLQWQGRPPTDGPCASGCAHDLAVTYCADLAYGDFTDWRLPTIQELHAIADYGASSNVFLDALFPSSSDRHRRVWSNTAQDTRPLGFYYLSFEGATVGLYEDWAANGVRCVRGAIAAPVCLADLCAGPSELDCVSAAPEYACRCAAGHFWDGAICRPCNGAACSTINDTGLRHCYSATARLSLCPTESGSGQDAAYVGQQMVFVPREESGDRVAYEVFQDLVWQVTLVSLGDCADGCEWAAAQGYCNGLSYGGHDDWRLPTVQELVGIVHYDAPGEESSDAMIDRTVFPGTPKRAFWTSESRSSGTDLWVVEFDGGRVQWRADYSAAERVRCVRDGSLP